MAIADAKRGHDSGRKKTAVAILPPLIFISPPHNAAHSLRTQWASRVNECYSVIYDTISFQRGKKIEQRGEKCRTPVTISAPVSEVTLLSRTFSLSLSLGVFTLQ